MILFQLLNMQADILFKNMKDRSTILAREMLAKGDAIHLIIYLFIHQIFMDFQKNFSRTDRK